MTNKTKGNIIKATAVTIDVAVPLAATLGQFPVWVEKSSEATMSGLFLIFAFLSCLPFIKQIKSFIKSPSVWVVWIIFFVLFVCLRNIIDQMIVVCFFGMISNLIGAGIYKIGERIQLKKDPEPEAQNSTKEEK